MDTLEASPNPAATDSGERSSLSPTRLMGTLEGSPSPPATDSGERSSLSPTRLMGNNAGQAATYTFGGAAKILDVAESKLRYWAQVGFVGPSVRRAGKPLYSFQDLVSVKAAKELVDRGFKAAEIRKAIGEVRATLPHLDRPLDRMRVAFDGTRLVVVDEGQAFESTGQKVFDFGLAELARQISDIRSAPADEGAPAAAPAPATGTGSTAPAGPVGPAGSYDWFIEGTRAESAGPAGDAHAEHCYRQALALDGGLAAARTNLGSLAYRRGDVATAREAFEAALAIDPDQPEARFNLANIVLETGDLELAVAEFRRVLQTAPDFADAHYNLAVALESLGGRAAARAHLERYLALETDATPWAEQARALIARLD
jgi:tetratricopeptide (TPR) repeat protein